jgi:hypothetical protein
MRDEKTFKEILRKLRKTPLEANCTYHDLGPAEPGVEVVDAECHTICVAETDEKASLIASIFDWLLDEAECDPDRHEAPPDSNPMHALGQGRGD